MGEKNATNITSSTSAMPLANEFGHYATGIVNNVTNETTEAYVDVTEETASSQRLWNLSRSSPVPLLPKDTRPAFDSPSTTIYTPTTTDPFDEFGPPEGIEYIFVPLGVVVFVIILSAVVWVIIISRKRKLERLRHRLMPMYNFDPGEEEEDDWETELLEECYNNHQRRQGYQSMDTEENAELFGSH